LVINTPTFTSVIEEYTPSCNLMVIFSNPEVSKVFFEIDTTTISMNILNSGKYFDKKMKVFYTNCVD
jgi:hypothetical protein